MTVNAKIMGKFVISIRLRIAGQLATAVMATAGSAKPYPQIVFTTLWVTCKSNDLSL